MSEAIEFGMRMHRFDDPANAVLAYEVDSGHISADMADPLWARFDIKHFTTDEADDALAWLKS